MRACVSRPGYDPENISASLNAPDSPLLERAFQCYAVGSVFKPVLAAAALEAGRADFVYTCPGWCAVDGRIFRCAGGIPHGEVDLAGALEKSCNGYFIRLGQALGADAVRAMAEQLGFGQAIPLTDALHTAAGVLPEREALASSGAYANFCFGQGELLASPLQVAAMMNTIACGGICRTPLLLETTLGRDHRHTPHGAFPCPEQAGAYKAHRRRPAGPVGGCGGRGAPAMRPPCPARPRQARPARPRPASFPAVQS